MNYKKVIFVAFSPPILVVLLQRQEPMSIMDRMAVRKTAIFFGLCVCVCVCVCECVCEMLAFLLSQLCFLEHIIQREREKLLLWWWMEKDDKMVWFWAIGRVSDLSARGMGRSEQEIKSIKLYFPLNFKPTAPLQAK